MQSQTEMSSDQPEAIAYHLNNEQLATRRLLYHLWRLDSAARSFPHDCSNGVEAATNKARWTIGLTLEMVSLVSNKSKCNRLISTQRGVREAIADVTLLGLMTTELSGQLARRTQWFDLFDVEPNRISWRNLPKGNTPPPVPSPPWMFGSRSTLLLTQRRWWDESCEEKPAWWEEPIAEVCCCIFFTIYVTH